MGAVKRWWCDPPAGASRRAVGLTTGALGLCAAIVSAAAVALLPVDGLAGVAALGASVSALIFGLVFLRGGDRLPRWCYHLHVVFGSLGGAAFVLLVDEGAESTPLAMPLLLLVVNVAAVSSLRVAVVEVALIVVLAGTVLLQVGVAPPLVGIVALAWLAIAALVALLARAADVVEEDPLTGLPNGRGFERRFRRAVAVSDAERPPLSVVVLNIDRLRVVDDVLGHQAADQVVAACAEQWRRRLPPDAVLARTGPDEFGLLLAQHNAGAAAVLVNQLLRACPDQVTASAGISQWQPGEPADQVRRRADLALQEAKRAGRDRVVISGRPGRGADFTGSGARRSVDPVTGALYLDPADEFGPVAAALVVEVDNYRTASHVESFEAADLLLAEATERILAEVAGLEAHIRRLHGPHLLVLLTDQTEQAVGDLANRLAYLAGEPAVGRRSALTIGIAIAEPHGSDVPALIRAAMTAAEHARRERPGGAIFFKPCMAEDARDRLALGRALRHAIDHRELSLVFQPQLHLSDGSLTGVEVLARWHDPHRGEIPPARFVSLAEEIGLSRPLDRLVYDLALAQLHAWDDAGLAVPRLSVNCTPESIDGGVMPDSLAEMLVRHRVAPDRVTVELIENRLLDEKRAWAVLRRFREMGVRVSLDDFGTGYASFSQLVTLPIDEVKIDRSFLAGHGDPAKDRTVLTAMVEVGRSLGHDVVAEGIETTEQLELLHELGCPVGQGYLLSRPMPARDFEAWLSQRPERPVSH